MLDYFRSKVIDVIDYYGWDTINSAHASYVWQRELDEELAETADMRVSLQKPFWVCELRWTDKSIKTSCTDGSWQIRVTVCVLPVYLCILSWKSDIASKYQSKIVCCWVSKIKREHFAPTELHPDWSLNPLCWINPAQLLTGFMVVHAESPKARPSTSSAASVGNNYVASVQVHHFHHIQLSL